jgi:hypothetical protein
MQYDGQMRTLWLGVALLAACGRISFDPTATAGGDGATGDGLTLGPPCTIGAAQPVAIGAQSATPSSVWTGTNLAVTWTELRGGEYEIRSALLDAGGAVVGATTNVSTTPGINSWFSTIAWSGSELAIAWSEEVQSDDALFRRVSAGNVVQGANVVLTSTSGDAWWPVVTWIPTAGAFAVAWADDTVDNYEIVLALRKSDGSQLTAATPVTATAQASWGPHAVWTGSELVIAYIDESTGVFVQRFDDAGTPIGGRATVIDNVAGADHAWLAWTGSELGVTWSDLRSGAPQVYFARLDAMGTPLAPDHQISHGIGARRPVLVWTGDSYAIAWNEDLGGAVSIELASLDASGGVRYGPTAIGPASGMDWPALAWTGAALAVVWGTPGTAGTDLVAARATCP